MISLKWPPLALMVFYALFAAFSIVFANISAGIAAISSRMLSLSSSTVIGLFAYLRSHSMGFIGHDNFVQKLIVIFGHFDDSLGPFQSTRHAQLLRTAFLGCSWGPLPDGSVEYGQPCMYKYPYLLIFPFALDFRDKWRFEKFTFFRRLQAIWEIYLKIVLMK